MENIISAAITGILALVGVIITSSVSNRKIERNLEIHQAVTDEKIENLTHEVRKHNNFAERVPVMEQKIKGIEEKMNIFHQQ